MERIATPYVLTTHLTGNSVVPPVTTNAVGTGVLELDPQTDTLTYQITFADLSSIESGAHLHGFAPPGSNANVLLDLGLGFHKTGSWGYPPFNEDAILDGQAYVQVHSANNPNGEIRGQVLVQDANPGSYCVAKANSQGCTPAIDWSGLPTLSGPDDLTVGATEMINGSIAALVVSRGSQAQPFMGGTLCIDAATSAVVHVQSAGGSAPPAIDCSGMPRFDFTQSVMLAQGLLAGDLAFAQWWYRDPTHPDGTGYGLTNAMAFEVLP